MGKTMGKNRIRVNGILYEALADNPFSEMDKVKAPSGYQLSNTEDVSADIHSYDFTSRDGGCGHEVHVTLRHNRGEDVYIVDAELTVGENMAVLFYHFEDNPEVSTLDDFEKAVAKFGRSATGFVRDSEAKFKSYQRNHAYLKLMDKSERNSLNKYATSMLKSYGLEEWSTYSRRRRAK